MRVILWDIRFALLHQFFHLNIAWFTHSGVGRAENVQIFKHVIFTD